MKTTRKENLSTSEASKTDATFEASQIPQRWTPRQEPKTEKKGFLTKLFEWIFSTPQTQEQRRPLTPEERQRLQDEEDEAFEQEQDEDDDFILGGAW